MAKTNGAARTDGVAPAQSAADPGGKDAALPFGLIDVESGNVVASYASERDALLAVAATAKEHGADSDAVLTLSLFREDVPPEVGFIADGEELVRRALEAAQQEAELPRS